MHNFDDLVYRSTSFTLDALEKANCQVTKALETSAPTSAVKNLQMLQLQKAILATGMFSLFDAILQEGLACRNGFEKAKKVLIQKREVKLHDRFEDFIRAINVLKHGRGESYDALVAKSESLPFRLKLPDENFFYEGDISEVSTLIEVNDEFVLNCAELIAQVSTVMRKEFPGFLL
jgi:hypothetical protein